MHDSILAQQAVAGHQQAFEQLVKRYSEPLLQVIYRYVQDYHHSHDILQQVFLQLYISLPPLRTTGPLKPWLYQVARNRCLDALRRKRQVITFSALESMLDNEGLSILETIPDTTPLPEEQVEATDLSTRLLKMLQALPHTMARVMYLRYIKQLTYAEIASVLHIPVATAKTYAYRARHVLAAQQEQLLPYLIATHTFS